MPIRRGDFSSRISVNLNYKRPHAIFLALDDCLSMVCCGLLTCYCRASPHLATLLRNAVAEGKPSPAKILKLGRLKL